MKVVLLLVLLVSIASCYYQGDCDCGDQHAFNHVTYTCDKYPTSGQQGYVEGCARYYLKGFSQLEWVCTSCVPSYNHEKGKCISNGIPGCMWADKLRNHQSEYLPKNEVSCRICDSSQDLYVYHYRCAKFPQQGQDGYVPHCTFYDSLRFCTDCQQGYYLYKRDCYKAETNIPNCAKYGDYPQRGKEQDCLHCEKGYVLKNRNQCIKEDEAIENCEVATHDFVNLYCVTCESGYYVNKERQCSPNPITEQEGQIENCQIYYETNYNEIKCKQCNDNYAMSLDKLRCEKLNIQPVDNCAQYEIYNNGVQSCQYCDSGSNSQRHNNVVSECKKCPAIPQQQLNIEEYSEEQGISQLVENLLNKLYSQLN